MMLLNFFMVAICSLDRILLLILFLICISHVLPMVCNIYTVNGTEWLYLICAEVPSRNYSLTHSPEPSISILASV